MLDEATSGQDPVVRSEMLDLFLEFIQDEEHSILLSSHITSDLEKVADYITFIHAGKIVFSKTKDDILEQYGVVKCEKARAAAAAPAGTIFILPTLKTSARYRSSAMCAAAAAMWKTGWKILPPCRPSARASVDLQMENRSRRTPIE